MELQQLAKMLGKRVGPASRSQRHLFFHSFCLPEVSDGGRRAISNEGRSGGAALVANHVNSVHCNGVSQGDDQQDVMRG
jgi:hypothetical protein